MEEAGEGKTERAWKQWLDTESELREERISRRPSDYEGDRATFTSSHSHPCQHFVQRLAHHPFIPVAYFRRKASSDVCVVTSSIDPTGFRSARLRLLCDFRMINRFKYIGRFFGRAMRIFIYSWHRFVSKQLKN